MRLTVRQHGTTPISHAGRRNRRQEFEIPLQEFRPRQPPQRRTVTERWNRKSPSRPALFPARLRDQLRLCALGFRVDSLR